VGSATGSDRGTQRRDGLRTQAILLDWGDTVMRVLPEESGPMARWGHVEALPGVGEALGALAPDAALALATSAADSDEHEIRQALARVGLDRWFSRVYCARQLGFRKAEAEFYPAVLADLGLPAGRVFMVGDSWRDDVQAANHAGLAAVWYAPGQTTRRAGARYRTIREFSELRSTLRELGFRAGHS